MVKKIISIGLILLMSVQSFYQLGVITYFQLNRDYIAEVLCINKETPMTMCYGQCFLDNNLGLGNDAQTDPAPVSKQKIEITVFIGAEVFYSFQEVFQLAELNSRYAPGFSSFSLPAPFHPPTVG